MGKVIEVTLTAVFLNLVLGLQLAHAYIDPSSGSYIIQVAITTLLGVLFGVKMVWRKIKKAVLGLFSKDSKE